jgi:ferredoxin
VPELEAQARKAGLDPFGVEVVNLGAYCAQVHAGPQATDKAKILLKAAVAKVGAFSESRPESLKPVFSWDHTVSRRALFTLPPLRYEPVAFIRRGDCAFEEGCRVCAGTCPWQALEPSEELMVLEKSRCTGCGACVSACPQTAIDLPGASPQQINAQIAALLNGASLSIEPRAILFVCTRSTPALEGLARQGLSYPAGWLPVEVPCVGMVTPTWLLQCLSLGAAATGVLPCLRDDCRFGKREVTEGRVGYCREFLGGLGASPEAVRLLDPRDERELARALSSLPELPTVPRAERPGDVALFGPRATASALLGLAERFAPPLDYSLAHPYSPVGKVTVEPGCTACEACVHACPTDALNMERDQEGVALTFDAGLCIGCEACVPACPERVVRVEKVTDLSNIAQGKRILHRDSEVRCEGCGAPVAPGAMLRRIAGMLGPEDAGTLSFITRYCASCRGSEMTGGKPTESDATFIAPTFPPDR